jgi:predicted secreted protein
MRKSPLLITVGVAALVAVSASSASDVPITQASSGKVFRIAKGESATLRLNNRWHWSDPDVSTAAVELTPVEYFVDPGFREWTVDATKVGRTTIRATGRPNRENVTMRHFVVTVVVTAGS